MKYTTDYDEIRGWIEEHGGVPSVIKDVPEDEGEESPEMLHVSFDPASLDVEAMSWEEFFERFENEHLAFVYDEMAVEGGSAPEFEFVDRDFARAEYGADTEMPDSGDADILNENLIPDHEGGEEVNEGEI